MAKAGRRSALNQVVPELAPTSYYGRPILKVPTWRWPIPAYLFTGGLAAGTALVGAGARLRGDGVLADRSTAAALGAVVVSAGLLVEDLGRPERFHHMLRVAKPTSPMSVGTWILSAFGGLVGGAAALGVGERTGVVPGRYAGPARAVTQVGAGVVAPALATYTAVLVADTAVPSWHEARYQLPWLFAGSAGAAGGAAGVLLGAADPVRTGGARRMALAGAALEIVGAGAMERRLRHIRTGDPDTPDLAVPLRRGRSGRLARAARAVNVAAAVALAAGRRPGRAGRLPGVVGSAGLLIGSALERFAVVEAGRVSAGDPVYTVGPQRAGLVDGARPA